MKAQNLANFPPEVFIEICAYLDAQDVLFLFRSSPLVKKVLCLGGIRSLEMPRLNQPGFPRFATSLAFLSKLVIKLSRESVTDFDHTYLLLLPPSLRHIEFVFEEALAIFVANRDFLDRVHDPTMADTRAPFYTKTGLNISILWPQLEYLELNGRIPYTKGFSFVRTLPASMTFLDLPSTKFNLKVFSIPLPSHMRTIRVPSRLWMTDLSKMQNLTDLDVGVVTDLACLPETLERFKWYAPVSVKALSDIPRFTRLRTLKCTLGPPQGLNPAPASPYPGDEVIEAISTMPLTKLTVMAEGRLHSASFQNLPRTLTKLKALSANRDCFDAAHLAHLPRALTYLHFTTTAASPFPPLSALQGIALLPPNLKYLYFPLLLTFTDFQPFLLPQSLTQLQHTIGYTAYFNTKPSASSALPKSLTDLDIDNPYPTTFLHDFFQALPHNLKSLRLNYCQLQNFEIRFLPSRLTVLQLPKTLIITNASMKALPRTLLHLDLPHCDCINSTGLSDLPPMLRILAVKGTRDRSINNDIVPKLPRSLRAIQIRFANWSDECVPHLPPLLQHLVLGDGRLFTDEGCRRMPRTLTLLILRLNRSITFRCLNQLPNTLMTLKLPKNIHFKKKAYLVPSKMILWTKALRIDQHLD